jgi:hypothetical protein
MIELGMLRTELYLEVPPPLNRDGHHSFGHSKGHLQVHTDSSLPLQLSHYQRDRFDAPLHLDQTLGLRTTTTLTQISLQNLYKFDLRFGFQIQAKLLEP